MLVKDEAALARHQRADAQAQYAERVNEATYHELSRARLMEDADMAPSNPVRQMGRLMTPHEFETRIVARLGVPNLVFEVHPTNPGKRIMYQVRGVEKHLVCVYENGPMPEFSIVEGVVRWVPDPDRRTVERADVKGEPMTMQAASDVLAQRGVAGLHAELDARIKDHEPSHLGMKRIVTPGRERVRGWRTVLVYMMQHGLVSPEQVRNAVEHADRASWAGYMGRTEALREWLR